mmetsp:Transcript_11875/g.19689  ORF Transcript_11875/g.19689 Transcript_11875/m.19689 type:complete len:335 (+) Transcript_11875:241-1245(+)
MTAVGVWSQLNDIIERNCHVRSLLSIQAHEIGIDNAQNALMGHDEDWFSRALEFLRERFEAKSHVHIRFASWIPIGQLIILSPLKFIWKYLFNLLVGHSIADTGIQFIQIASCHGTELHPFQIITIIPLMIQHVMVNELRRLLGATHRRGPKTTRTFPFANFTRRFVSLHDNDFLVINIFLPCLGNVILGKLGQPFGVLDAVGTEARITSNLAQDIVFRLSMTSEVEGTWQGMEVHDKVYDFQWQITTNVVDNKLFGIDNFEVRSIGLIDWFVDRHVIGTSFLKIEHCLFWIHISVIGSTQFDFFNIFLQQFLRIANAFDKHFLASNAGGAQRL